MCIRDSLGVHHAAAQNLDPALALADAAALAVAGKALHIHLGGGLGLSLIHISMCIRDSAGEIQRPEERRYLRGLRDPRDQAVI